MHDLDSALDAIRARDDTAARHAHALWHVMRSTAAHPTKVTRYDVQRMMWRTLPQAHLRPGGDGAFDDLHATCESFAELLDLLGHESYAALCRAEVTRRILDSTGHDARFRLLVDDAWRSSGVLPPDTPTLTWSEQAGPVETALHAAVGRLLEEAITAGTLPADGGESPERVALVTRLLTSLGDDDKQTWLASLIDERLDAWTVGRGSQTRREMLVRVRPEVRRPPGVARAPLPAVEMLLAACAGPGARLTARGYLPTALVARLAEVMPACGAVVTRVRSETKYPPIRVLRALVTAFDLVHADSGRLKLTSRGAAVLDDPHSLPAWVGGRMVTRDRTMVGTVEEVVLAALLLEDRLPPSRILEKLTYALTEAPWPESAVPVPSVSVARGFLHRLRVLDVIEITRTEDGDEEMVGLTEPGRAIARWSLRTRVLHGGTAAETAPLEAPRP
ncbi:MAG: hypothetical protein M3548_08160 [Actinomycetota bacterium]|nr:hypothetical protein [Actinomycetota bacterium]